MSITFTAATTCQFTNTNITSTVESTSISVCQYPISRIHGPWTFKWTSISTNQPLCHNVNIKISSSSFKPSKILRNTTVMFDQQLSLNICGRMGAKLTISKSGGPSVNDTWDKIQDHNTSNMRNPAYHSFLESKLMSSDVLFCPCNSLKNIQKNIQFTVTS